MKTKCLCFFAGIGLIFFSACHSSSQKNTSPEKDTTLVKMNLKVSDSLSSKMNTFLDAYYQLKDAFVKSDSAAADSAARNLLQNTGTLSLNELEPDTARYHKAQQALTGLSGEIAGLLSEKSILGKRKEFQKISDISYDLITSAGPKGVTVYRDFCPMFNEGKGAYWLSSMKRINNPYYGDEMLGCGEINQTMQF